MNHFSWISIFIVLFIFINCDTGVRISQNKLERSIATSAPHSNLTIKNTTLPSGLRKTIELMHEVSPHKNIQYIFSLPYFLIPEEDFKIFKTNIASSHTTDQLILIISGIKYFRFFVDQKNLESLFFLKNAYRFIDQDNSEFAGTYISNNREAVVWNKYNSNRRPFIVSLSTENKNIAHYSPLFHVTETEYCINRQNSLNHINAKFGKSTPFNTIPHSFGFIFYNKSKKGAGKLSGQIVSEIPDEIIKENLTWASLHTLIEKKSPGTTPLIVTAIKNSNLSSYRFIQKYFVNNFLQLLNLIVLEGKVNFGPNLQNVGLELNNQLAPTSKLVILNPTSPIYQDLKLQRKHHRSGDAFTSYYLFYRKYVLEKLLPVIALNDSSLSQEQIKMLEEESEKTYYKYLTQYLKHNLSEIPSKEIIQGLINTSTRYIASVDSDLTSKLKDGYGITIYIDRKKAKQEWLQLSTKGKEVVSDYFVTNHGVYELTEDHITGVAIFTPTEIKEYEKNNQALPNFFKN